MDHTLEFLKEQKVQEGLIRDVELFRKEYAVEETELSRVSEPDMLFYGKEVLEMAIAALLEGENLLLTGAKATGKTCWQKILHGYLEDLFIMCPFM